MEINFLKNNFILRYALENVNEFDKNIFIIIENVNIFISTFLDRKFIF